MHPNTQDRWVAMGPYYAMFPISFAESVILKYTDPGDVVLDPFVGRGTSVYLANKHDRRGIGIDIGGLGWIYSSTKLNPARQSSVLARVNEIYKLSRSSYSKAARDLPEFFHYCFSTKVRRFLLAARSNLDWKHSVIDRTLIAFILISLHDKYGVGFSNQMRQTKAMAPAYSIKWWKKNGYRNPPAIDPVALLSKRIEWRYRYGVPRTNGSRVYYGDCTEIMHKLKPPQKARLLLTSPPYAGVTNYKYDQWLRNWLIGGPSEPNGCREKYDFKFSNSSEYKHLLFRAFEKSAQLLSSKGVAIVRTDARKFTFECTMDALYYAFPKHKMLIRDRPLGTGRTQTRLFGDSSKKPGEIDICMLPN